MVQLVSSHVASHICVCFVTAVEFCPPVFPLWVFLCTVLTALVGSKVLLSVHYCQKYISTCMTSVMLGSVWPWVEHTSISSISCQHHLSRILDRTFLFFSCLVLQSMDLNTWSGITLTCAPVSSLNWTGVLSTVMLENQVLCTLAFNRSLLTDHLLLILSHALSLSRVYPVQQKTQRLSLARWYIRSSDTML